MLHGLIAGGLAALDTTVFGAGRYSAALVDAGASVFDGLSGAVFIHPQHGVWTPVTEPHAPMQIAFCSRHVFEGAARRLVAGNARVELQYGACVDGLLFADAEAKAVTGVYMRVCRPTVHACVQASSACKARSACSAVAACSSQGTCCT